jgi:hypothetical protein
MRRGLQIRCKKLAVYTKFLRFGLKYRGKAMQNWSNSKSRYNYRPAAFAGAPINLFAVATASWHA